MLLFHWGSPHIVCYSSFNVWCFCIIVIKEDVDSDAASFYPTFDLGCYIKADNGGGEEQLIGICWAWQLLTQMPKCYRAGEHSIRSVAKYYMFLFNLFFVIFKFWGGLRLLALSKFLEYHAMCTVCSIFNSTPFTIQHHSSNNILLYCWWNGNTRCIRRHIVITFKLMGLGSLQGWFVYDLLPCLNFKAWNMSWM